MSHNWAEQQIINRLRKDYPNDDKRVMVEFIYDHWDNDITINENVANYCNYRGCFKKDGSVTLENLKR